ncbi:MAG: type II secretion system protein [bacterium]|jgi:prepilin-type N-terminal cleavage/methylation domain-containing protein
MKLNKAFTLIELATVMTIIGILAAIAVPNFLNASVRAKVARSQAEQEVLLWALESYQLDHNAYPLNQTAGTADGIALSRLTTPIPYMSQVPGDIFLFPPSVDKSQFITGQRKGNPFYFYLNFLQVNEGRRMSLQDYNQNGSANYMLYGLGPHFDFELDPMNPGTFSTYSPSNGTISAGIINTFGP